MVCLGALTESDSTAFGLLLKAQTSSPNTGHESSGEYGSSARAFGFERSMLDTAKGSMGDAHTFRRPAGEFFGARREPDREARIFRCRVGCELSRLAPSGAGDDDERFG
jgi:hypothetical protein